jgi:hypothetical protein
MAQGAPTTSTRRLQGVLLAFVALAVVGLLVIARLQPTIYARDLAAVPGWAAPPLVVGALAAAAVLLAGILRRWRWTFWLLLGAFGLSALRVPLLPLQLAGLLPGGDPAWYAIVQASIGVVQAAIAVWMVRLYRYHGVWACRRPPSPPGCGSGAADHEEGATAL